MDTEPHQLIRHIDLAKEMIGGDWFFKKILIEQTILPTNRRLPHRSFAVPKSETKEATPEDVASRNT